MHLLFLQGTLEAEVLVSEHFITHQPAQPARTTARTASSSVSQFWHPASASIHTLTPFQGSTRPGATPQLGEGEGDGKIKAGQKETRFGPQASGATAPVKRARRRGFWGHYTWFRQEALLQDGQGSHSGLGQ